MSATCATELLTQPLLLLVTFTLYLFGAFVGPPSLIAVAWFALFAAAVIAAVGATDVHKNVKVSLPGFVTVAVAVPSGVMPAPVVQLCDPVVANETTGSFFWLGIVFV